ncbi:MAG: hypothetical protein C5B59_04205 [Bacteroidetes bacterium]|nr:MAG: hypothetical protein C5B59_04205 [Bacteroidota bacterium]
MSYEKWRSYFTANSSHFEGLDWNDPVHLTQLEKARILSSIQQFQKGEQSEGKHLFAFAKKMGDPVYMDTIRLFIREEQKHACVLGEFMDREGIPRIREHWVDNIFRWLRKLAGLENTIFILVIAEIIAKIYYKALYQATESNLLKKICLQILQDEDYHIAFQAHTLRYFFKRKSRLSAMISRIWHRFLMAGTVCVVWLYHRPVLKSGAFGFWKFYEETMEVFSDLDILIKYNKTLQLAWI